MKLRTTPLAGVDRDLQRELRTHAVVVNSLARMVGRGFPYIVFDELDAAPTPTIANMVVFANGTSWNPGSGRGLYRWDDAITDWIFLG
jgi:hypothetical protein